MNKLIVDDGHLQRRDRVVLVESSASLEPNAKRLEIPCSDHLIMRSWTVSFTRPGSPKNFESLANVPSLRRQALPKRDGAHARQRCDFLFYFVVESERIFRFGIVTKRQGKTHGKHALRVESRIDLVEAFESACQQHRSGN